MFISAIILAAGSGTRMGAAEDKLMADLYGMTPLELSLSAVQSAGMDEVILCASRQNYHACVRTAARFPRCVKVVLGGSERQHSVYRGLQAVHKRACIVLIHDAARCFVTQDLVKRCVHAAWNYGSGVAMVRVKDTIKRVHGHVTTLNRASLFAAQTPQAFRRDLIMRAYEDARANGFCATDDASLVERLGQDVRIVSGSYENIKLTTPEDLWLGKSILGRRLRQQGFIGGHPYAGAGFDVHRLVHNRKLILGGVHIPFEKGLLGHSDADVLLHAVMDAVLGAAGLGDIGRHFPDTDGRYEGMNSLRLAEKVYSLIAASGWRVHNIDACVMAQRPKLSPYHTEMRQNIADAFCIQAAHVNIKATTTEGLGYIGRGLGIAANAVATLIKKSGGRKDGFHPANELL
jgi:2-C-methyl-D-erythritol 4-phosphate cytidylyltransferase/2-C-methyl-D-erythritol 2,4-cyclodiphosphate synthase